MTVSEPTVRRRVEVGPDFPVVFQRPGRRGVHVGMGRHAHPVRPHAARGRVSPPLGCRHERSIRLDDFPQRWRIGVWNGYAYFALVFDGSEEAFAELATRWESLWRDRLDGTAPGGGTRPCPSSGPSTSGSRASMSTGCTGRRWRPRGPRRGGRPSCLGDPLRRDHGAVPGRRRPGGPVRAGEPGRPASEAMTLIQGYSDDLHAVEVGLRGPRRGGRARRRRSRPALRSRDRVTRDDLCEVEGGQAFVGRARRLPRRARPPRTALR